MRSISISVLIILLFTLTTNAQIKYADVIIEAVFNGSPANFDDFYGFPVGSNSIQLVDPSICLGNNSGFVGIPKGSYITVGFTDNIIFDAPNQDDIYIDEVGAADELAEVHISSDFGQSFTYFGKINGGTINAIDLNDINYTGLVNAVKVVGLDNNGSVPGFDLARIYGIEGANCTADAKLILPPICQDSVFNLEERYPDGIWSGDILTNGLLETSDSGHFFLTHIVHDQFAICPSDTALIEAAIVPCDCTGEPFGSFELDICGQCLSVEDSLFNLSCLDCLGIPNGASTYDDCGVCLLPNDPRRCKEDEILYIPNAFSPNNDGYNDFFRMYARPTVDAEIETFAVFDRWGAQLFQASQMDIKSHSNWWDGRYKGKEVPSGTYVYYLTIYLPEKDKKLTYSGDVTIQR